MPLQFGRELGVFNGVPAYSSDYDSADDREYPGRHSYMAHHDSIYTGFKYQCVEYGRRYLVAAHGHTFPDVGMAYEIFDLRHFHLIVDKSNRSELVTERVPAVKCANGKLPVDDHSHAAGANRPQPGYLIIWHAGGFFRHTGHVGVVAEVVDHGGNKFGVRIAEQNVHDEHWEGKHYARELPAMVDANGAFHITETSPKGGSVKGWIAPVTLAAHMTRGDGIARSSAATAPSDDE